MAIPTSPANPYSPEQALDDLPATKYAANLFLNSKMVESESFCEQMDPKKERLYITAGYSLIQCLKALMSYEKEDLQRGAEDVRRGNALTIKHRAPASMLSRFAKAVQIERPPSLASLKAMTPVQRHAELLYAETTFAKALLGCVSSGSWFTFVSEALSFRVMINLYMQLGKFVETMDAEAAARGEPYDMALDRDFRSGVELGVGASNLILSLTPNGVQTVVEFFGYQANRTKGLALLMKAGGWSTASPEPAVSAEQEGIRRFLADIALLVFHLILGGFFSEGVDIPLAQNILDWNLRRYPDGFFYHFLQGRLRTRCCKPALALESYKRAIAVQQDYPNFHYVAYWEMALANLSLMDYASALEAWHILRNNSSWSPACYGYGKAACLIELGGESNIEEAAATLQEIPKLVHKVAGKSIPIEKFVARKARKFEMQGRRLFMPALEFGYLFYCIEHAPRPLIQDQFLPAIRKGLLTLKQHQSAPSTYGNGQGYWDDLCLAYLLEGVCLRYLAYPESTALIDPDDDFVVPPNAATDAMEAFQVGLKNADCIELDHWVMYYTHYELGRLYACVQNEAKAREHLLLVQSGQPLESLKNARKGKYSMQTPLMYRASAELEKLLKGHRTQ